MNSVKAVIFDIGRVILPVDWEKVTASLGLTVEQAESLRLEVVHGPHYDSYERGDISTSDFFAGFSKHYGLDHPTDELVSAWNSMIHAPFDGIEDVLQQLKKKVEIYTLSNTSQAHADHFLGTYKEFEHFHGIHTSFSLKARKPEKEIYLALLDEINHLPENTLFLDDLVENLEVAKGIGMNAEQTVNSVEQTKTILKKYGLRD